MTQATTTPSTLTIGIDLGDIDSLELHTVKGAERILEW